MITQFLSLENLNMLNFLFLIQSFTAIAIFAAANPMHSILFMILLFFEVAVVLAVFGLEFFSILFILVYVGAIAILFLFIVKLLTLKDDDTNLISVGLIFFFWDFFFGIWGDKILTNIFYKSENYLLNIFDFNFDIDILHDLHIIAQILYNYYIICFLIAGLILLVALVGAVSISYDFNEVKMNKGVFRKLSRSSNFLAFFQ